MSKKKDTLQTDLFPNLIEKPKKPLNEFQTRNFLYMIDRIRSYRFSKLGEARRLEEKELDKLPRPEASDIIKMLKNGKLTPMPTSKGKSVFYIEESDHAVWNQATNTYDVGFKLSFGVRELHGFKSIKKESEIISQKWKEQERLDNELIAGIKIKLRLGHIDSETAENFVNTLMGDWNVPITIVAEANHTNASCAR